MTDPSNIGIIYAAVDNGEILVFDTIFKGENNVDCKLKGKLYGDHGVFMKL